ncbi:MAG: hypothetical protein AB8I69_09295 [Anaerolineae bacterium]
MATTRYPITVEGETADIGTAGELVAALDVLQGNYDRAVLEQLRPYLAKVIGGPQGLHATLKVLAAEDQLYLIEALGPRLVDVIQRAGALRDILATLAESGVEEKLMETLGPEGLRALVGSPEDLAGVLEWVYGTSDWLALQLLGVDFLGRLFQSGYELSLVLYSLDRVRQQELIELLGWENVMVLVHDRRDLAHLLRALPAELSNRLLTHFTKDQLWAIVQDECGWHYLYNYLEAEEAAYLSGLLEVNDAQ